MRGRCRIALAGGEEVHMRRPPVIVGVAAVLALATVALPAVAKPSPLRRAPSVLGPACPAKVAAFYYGWYGGPSTDWRHWVSPTRSGIAATDYPVLGPYDSQDPSVIDQHLTWTVRAGIDVLVSSWWGLHTYEDDTLGQLLHEIEATGSPVRASAYIETWALFQGDQFGASFFDDTH